MSLEDLEHELYRTEEKKKKSSGSRVEQVPVSEPAVPGNWGDVLRVEDRDVNVSHRKTYAIALAGVLALVVGGLTLFFTGFGGSRPTVQLDAFVPSLIARGVPFDLSVEAMNQSDVAITGGTIEVRLPEGVRPAEGDQSRAVLSADISSVAPNTLTKQSFKLLPLGGENTVEKVSIVFSYTSGSGSRFETTFSKEVMISKAAVTVTVAVPDKVISGSTFETVISYENSSEATFSGLALRVKYPASFKVVSSSPQPSGPDGSWLVPKLAPGERGRVSIRGFIDGSSDGQTTVLASLVASAAGTEYNVAEQSAGIGFSPSPVSLEVLVNNRSDYVAQTGETLAYMVRYRNESGIALAGAVISLQVSGALVDPASVKTSGSFNSNTNTVTWTAAQVPALKLIEPGASGSVDLRVGLRASSPNVYSPKNFAVKVFAQFESPSVPYYLEASSTSAIATLETRIGGSISVTSKVYYRDVAFPNPSGPFPPKVNQPTRFTVRWRLVNAATDAHDVVVRASLRGGVAWTTSTKVTEGDLEYDARTQEVTWTLDKLSAMKGVVTNPAEAVFQVEVTPSVTQIGQFAQVVSETLATGTDDFTGGALASRAPALSSSVPDDSSVAQNSGKVLP